MTIEHPEKIGIGGWENGDPLAKSADGVILNGLDSVGFSWYQDWHPRPLIDTDSTPENIHFVPALWDLSDATQANLDFAKTQDNLLITYNEPWAGWQNISVQQALNTWPQLMSTGMRLTSPSITNLDGQAWLDQFMAGANSKGYRVDVINVHYYTKDGNVDAFKQFLTDTHNRYGKPMIVTEWGMANFDDTNTSLGAHQAGSTTVDFTTAQQAAFAKAGTEMMDDLPFIERQAWFAATDGGGFYLNSGVLNPDGSMTPVGRAFYDEIHGEAIITPPPPAPSSGLDTLTLNMGEDFYQTNAQFTVAVDGQQVGGIQTATARNALGQSEDFTFSGDWAPGNHTVSVNLLNDGWDGYPWWANGDAAEGHDRNIYVNGAAYDGQGVGVSPIFINRSDVAGSFMVTDSSSSAPDPTPAPAPGVDTLTVRVSADHLNGTDPNMVVSLDGRVLDDTNFVSAIHQNGQWQDFTYTGSFGAGQHDVGISMSQDGWDGTNWWSNGSSPEGHDLNLYVDSVTLNGRANDADAFINMAGTVSHWSL